MQSKVVVGCAALTLVLAGCGAKKEGDGGPTTSTEATPTEGEKNKLRGRCENESSDAPYGSLYFFPDKNELFLASNGGANRIPIVVTKQDEKKVDFTFKWQLDDDKPVQTGTGSFSWIGTQKWNFTTDALKDAICHPVDDALFYENVTKLGIKPGKYLDAKSNQLIDLGPDAQKFVLEAKGNTTIKFYRVRSKSADAGVTIYYSSTAPSDSKPVPWVEATMSMLGEDLVFSLGKATFRFAPVK